MLGKRKQDATTPLASRERFKRSLYRHGLGLVITAAIMALTPTGIFDRLERIAYDVRLRLTLTQQPHPDIVIADIDEAALQTLGRWPWRRDKMAALTDTLFTHYMIGAVGFDVVFAEPDDSSGKRYLTELASGKLAGDTALAATLARVDKHMDLDAQFADALHDKPTVLGYPFDTTRDTTTSNSSGALPPSVIDEKIAAWMTGSVPHAKSFAANLPVLQQAAAGGGHINPKVDLDGVIRSVPVVIEHQSKLYEALSVSLVRQLIGAEKIEPVFDTPPKPTAKPDLAGFNLVSPLGSWFIPTDEKGHALVPYRGGYRTFPYISIADIVKRTAPVEALAGKLVIVGATAPGLLDLRATPVANVYPGVEVHANLMAGILDKKIPLRPKYEKEFDLVQMALLGLLLTWLLPRMKPFRAWGLTLTFTALLLAGNFMVWSRYAIAMPIVPTATLIFGLLLGYMGWGYLVESASKRQFSALFGQYVPPELVEQMAEDPTRYSMEGRNAELTVLFSDVRDFTSISEKLDAKQLSHLINEYLTEMSDIIRLTFQGTLDKYIGDAIMCFWGAPVAQADHARRAVLAALAMHKRMREMEPMLMQKYGFPLHIGVGVNSGQMTVGDMGSNVRRAYTVMGDNVNLGSRLEGLTKNYGVGVMVSESTRAAVPEMGYRLLDRVRVKGKQIPIAVFEPVGLIDELSEDIKARLETWNAALQAYFDQDWARATGLLQPLIGHPLWHNEDYLYKLYLERIAHYHAEPPPADWDGVTTFTTK